MSTRRAFDALVSTTLLVATAHASGPTPVDKAFFSLDLAHSAYDTAGHFPIIPFGSMRPSDAGVDWRGIETSNGTFSWTKLDTWIGLTVTSNTDMLLTIDGTPAWASLRPTEAGPGCSGCAAPPSDVDSGDALYKEYVTALVQHSLASAKPIKYYEIWNEFDGGFWTGTSAQMVTMAKDAYAIIHALDPNAKVVGPSISSCCGSGNGLTTLTSYLAAGGNSPVAQDFISIHSYPAGSEPLYPDYVTQEIATVKSLAASYGLPNIRLMYTEGSYNGSKASTKTDAQKVAFLAQQFLDMWTAPVDRYYWFQYDNATFGTLWQPGTGLTPEGVAYQALESWLVGSTSADSPCATDASSTVTCSLTLANGNAAAIVYNDMQSVSYATGTFTSLLKLDGSTTAIATGTTVMVGPEPIMLVAQAAKPAAPTMLSATVR